MHIFCAFYHHKNVGNFASFDMRLLIAFWQKSDS